MIMHMACSASRELTVLGDCGAYCFLIFAICFISWGGSRLCGAYGRCEVAQTVRAASTLLFSFCLTGFSCHALAALVCLVQGVVCRNWVDGALGKGGGFDIDGRGNCIGNTYFNGDGGGRCHGGGAVKPLNGKKQP